MQCLRRQTALFFDRFADHAVQRFNGVGGVNHFPDIRRIVE